ncbi:hypothetical protein [Ureibacillus acetophenoni]|uniref:Uncharacterized protein n=1 Tax=Ureibacillus acetophenoni TaxID=614649 RepID=A0A285UMS6_9BACL|nr:hypothetical protein [Ureibacillus acetophenoni]SOC43215.1 hypothetical protein SAMN05877842_11514 [Ureibacillus acetophenoni]
MKRINKKLLLIVVIIILVIAGLLDLKFEGLFYQMLPESVQSMISNIFNG